MDRRLTAVLALFLLVTVSGAYGGAMEWDEGSFLLNAEYFQGTDTNFEESRPAVLSYLISALWQVTGENVFAARVITVLFGIGTILLFHRIASHEFDDPLPVTATFAFAPLLLYWSFHVYTDVPALFFVLLSLYLYRQDRHLFAGVSLAAAITFRYVFLVFAVGMAASYLFEHRDAFPRYAAGGILGSFPFFSYSFLAYGSPFAKIRMYVTRVSEWSGSGPFATTAASTGSALFMLAPLLPAALLGWRDSPMVEKGMLVAYALFFLFLSGNSFFRYWLAILPFLLLMGYRGLRTRRTLFILSAVAMIVVSGIGVGMNAADLQTCSQPFDAAVSYVSEREGTVVSDQWAVTGYKLDRPVYSPWTDYETLRDDQNVTYAITREVLPYQRVAQFSNVCETYNVYDLRES